MKNFWTGFGPWAYFYAALFGLFAYTECPWRSASVFEVCLFLCGVNIGKTLR
jgi:hypothetical protein